MIARKFFCWIIFAAHSEIHFQISYVAVLYCITCLLLTICVLLTTSSFLHMQNYYTNVLRLVYFFDFIQLNNTSPLLMICTAPTPSQRPRDPPRSAMKVERENSGM